ncbi:hypothetical protein [Halopseudomonas salegens]|uniref:General secretion pathway protein C n=1 Tax=Halopseudomonas salegens TaxID=1434072 RepID=A0A1H2HXC7_9GAMM|nr:hypothetical protein [Halopseudomonas salegens]SDU36188.1 hypothetical protein SAMN05216210_3365 [Halopseudomonas salegens]
MSHSSIARRITLLLTLALILVVCWILAVLLLSSPDPVRTPQMQVPQLPDASFDDAMSADLEPALLRPLFWESRRPIEEVDVTEPAPAEPQQAEPLKDVTLLGVLLVGDQRSAIVRHAGEVVRLQENDELAGWTLLRVYPDKIELRSGRRTHSLPLREPLSPQIQLQ